MNTIKLRPIITVEEKNTFVSEIQEAFQISYVSEFGEFEKQVLPAEDIEESFNAKGGCPKKNGQPPKVNYISVTTLPLILK